MKTSVKPLAISLLGSAVAALSNPAWTQESSSRGPIEEVVVTAQFREQNLQDTPIAITALNASMLAARGHASVIDVAASAPSVTLQPASAGMGNSIAASIRGIGQYDFNLAMEPGVGIYIDDVYHPTLFGSIFDLLDLERVEVLRGPQGTLAGKNSIGGAIKLYSKRPTGSGDGFLEATYGEGSRVDFRGAYDFSLVPDLLFMRLSGVSKRQDGHVKRVDYGCATGLAPAHTLGSGCRIGSEGSKDYQGLRASLRWVPTEKLEVNFSADAAQDDAGANPSILVGTLRPVASTPYIAPNHYTSYAAYNGDGYSVPDVSRAEGFGYAAEVGYEIAPDLAFKSITAYREYEAEMGMDIDGSPLPVQSQHYVLEYESFTQEFRLSGVALQEALNYTGGLYYFRGRGFTQGRVDLGATGDFLTGDPADTDHIAAFLHASYQLTESWDVSLGLRYTDEEKEISYSRRDPENPSQLAAPPYGPLSGSSAVSAEERVDYRFSTNYRWTPDFMTYATVSTGYKGGGVNPRAYVPSQVVPFGPEELTAYEIGFKSDWFDNRARLNVSGFLNDYEDIQLTILTGYGGFALSAVPLNVGEAEIKGIEFELQMEPIDGLMIDVSGSRLDFEYKSLTAEAQASGIQYGMWREYTPEKQGALGIQYEIGLGRYGSLTPRFDVVHQGSFYANATNDRTNQTDSYTYSNARLTYRSPKDDWEVALAVYNLSDKEYFVNTFANLSSGTISKTPARPREWALSFRYNFQ